jgi:hypothetical protein
MIWAIPPDALPALLEESRRQTCQARLWLAENGHRAAGPREPPPGSSGASRAAAAKATRLRRLRLAEAALPPAPPSGR